MHVSAPHRDASVPARAQQHGGERERDFISPAVITVRSVKGRSMTEMPLALCTNEKIKHFTCFHAPFCQQVDKH